MPSASDPARLLVGQLEPRPQPCPYLTNRQAQYEEYLFLNFNAGALDWALERGFRHFGEYFFRPACPGAGDWCGCCVPVRVPAEAFRMSKSQRRVWRRAQPAFAIQWQRPAFSPEKFQLYQKHKTRFAAGEAALRQQGETEPAGAAESMAQFAESFYAPASCAWECEYRLDGRLAAVGLADLTPRAMSSVYFFFDPDCAPLSPGTFSVLEELRMARETGASHYYLGYTMAGNHSLRYKTNFRPLEYFDGAAWRPLRDAAGGWLAPLEGLRTNRATPLAG